MAQLQETRSPLGVLFVDISDSTRLYWRLGDERAADAVLQLLAKLSVVVEGHGGRVVDRIGDELMCVFESVSQTVEAAVDLQWAASAFAMDRPDLDDVTVRIGLHFGPVIEESGRIFGETVYTAKRMVSRAKPQQIILTGATAVQLGDSSPFALRFVDNALLKGHRTASELHEVIWNPRIATDQWLNTRELAFDLEVTLNYRDTDIVLCKDRPVLTMGRWRNCDLVVHNRAVSQLHARLVCHKRTALFTDLSTNGTFVEFEPGRSERIHQEAVSLRGSGVIGLGREPRAGSRWTIAFACRVQV